MYAYYSLMNVRNNKMNVPFKQPINNVQFRKLEGVNISACEKNITKCTHTGNALPEDVAFFQSNGVNSVFIKPLNTDLFLEEIMFIIR